MTDYYKKIIKHTEKLTRFDGGDIYDLQHQIRDGSKDIDVNLDDEFDFIIDVLSCEYNLGYGGNDVKWIITIHDILDEFKGKYIHTEENLIKLIDIINRNK